MQTLDYDNEFDRGNIDYIEFDLKKSYIFYFCGGVELPLNFSPKTIYSSGYPTWDGIQLSIRYTLNYQRNPSVFLHTPQSLGQDFLENYQPYMDFNNTNELIKMPLSNWSHHLQFVIRVNFNPALSKERTKNLEAKKVEQEESE